MRRIFLTIVGCLILLSALTLMVLTGALRVSANNAAVDGVRAYRDLEKIVAIGPRVAGTTGSAKTRAYIQAAVEDANLKAEFYSFKASTPYGARDMTNVVVTIPGTRPEVILLSGHYDTKYFPDFPFVGANDGGSSTALLLEMARVLGPQREGYTVWLCLFDGEEAFKEWSSSDSLYGSKALVKLLKERDELSRIKAMVNVDMIGDCDLKILKDPGAPLWLSETIWSTAEELGVSEHFDWIEQDLQDDHRPFRDEGIECINLIDFRYGGTQFEHGLNWHTSNDTLDKVCAESLQIVGDVLYRGLGTIEKKLIEGESRQDGD